MDAEGPESLFAPGSLLVFESGQVEEQRREDERESVFSVDGMQHELLLWSFPSGLPCRWCVFDSEAQLAGLVAEAAVKALEVFVVVRRPEDESLRSAALAALGLSARRRFPRKDYLWLKGQVDGLSRSRAVSSAFMDALEGYGQVTLLDVGAGCLGLADHARRCLEAAEGADLARYVAVDSDADLLYSKDDCQVERIVADVFDESFIMRTETFDVVVANAFADLAPPQTLASLLRNLTNARGLVYLPITFAGQTWLEPSLADDEKQNHRREKLFLDDAMAFDEYHRHLQRNGQHFDIGALKKALDPDFELIAEDTSDWRVPLGARFSTYIAHFLASALVPLFLAQQGDTHTKLQGLRWVHQLRKEAWDQDCKAARHLCAHNVDLLFRRRQKNKGGKDQQLDDDDDDDDIMESS